MVSMPGFQPGDDCSIQLSCSNCSISITVSTLPCQGKDGGSIPLYCSKRKDMGKKELLKKHKEELKTSIFDALVISDEVFSITIEILKSLFWGIKLAKGQPLIGTIVKSGYFPYNKCGITIDVIWSYCDAPTLQMARNLGHYDEIKSYPSVKALSITFNAVEGKYDEYKLTEEIRKAVLQFFENPYPVKEQKVLFQWYETAIGILNNKECGIVRDISEIFRIGWKYKDRELPKAAYKNLMKSTDYYNQFQNAIEKTQIFRYLNTINNNLILLQDVEKNSEEDKIVQQRFGLSVEKVIKIGNYIKKQLFDQVITILKQAFIDYPQQHNIELEIASEDRGMEETTEDKEKRLSEINKKYFCKY